MFLIRPERGSIPLRQIKQVIVFIGCALLTIVTAAPVLSVDPPSTVDQLLNEAEALLAKGLPAEASQRYKDSIRLNELERMPTEKRLLLTLKIADKLNATPSGQNFAHIFYTIFLTQTDVLSPENFPELSRVLQISKLNKIEHIDSIEKLASQICALKADSRDLKIQQIDCLLKLAYIENGIAARKYLECAFNLSKELDHPSPEVQASSFIRLPMVCAVGNSSSV